MGDDGALSDAGKLAGDDQQRADPAIDRRTFLAGATAVTGVIAIDAIAGARFFRGPHRLRIRGTSGVGVDPLAALFTNRKPSITVLVNRREDMLALRIDGYGLRRDGQRLVRHGNAGSYLVVTFPPQHLTEEAFPQNAKGTLKAGVPGRSHALLAYPSRLAFGLHIHQDSIPFTLASLLDWGQLEASVAPAAYLDAAGVIREPSATETALELPWHLVLSPDLGGQWSHPIELSPVAGQPTELWMTKLETPRSASAPIIRAVWNYDTETRDFTSPGRPTLKGAEPKDSDATNRRPFLTSLSANDRYQIVRATSDVRLHGIAPIRAKRLWLSSRGAFLDSEGEWNSTDFDLVDYKHQATLGRDQYVKVVKKGYLFPFGHRVVETTVTERVFEKVGSETVATSRQIVYLVVRDPMQSYGASTFATANDSRDFPFRSLQLVTARTPALDQPKVDFTAHANPGLLKGSNFEKEPYVPIVGGKPFQWHFIGTDWIGRQIPFSVPAVFVGQQDAWDVSAAIVQDIYNGLSDNEPEYASPIRITHLHGQRVAFAESAIPGDTDLEVTTLQFAANLGLGVNFSPADFAAHDQAWTYPSVLWFSHDTGVIGGYATVRLAAVEQISGGQPLASGQPILVSYHPGYIDAGFSTAQQRTANKGNVFIDLLEIGTNLEFASGSAGGVFTPNFGIGGISRSLGPVCDTDDTFNGIFDPAKIFPGLSGALEATILGGVQLGTLLAPVQDISVADPDNPDERALQIKFSDTGKALVTHLAWMPDIVSTNQYVTDAPDAQAAFSLDAKITNDLVNPSNSSYSITGTLAHFVVTLNSTGDPFVSIWFDELTFKSATGSKSKVTVKVHPNGVTFLGSLAFVEKLSEFMGFVGGGGPKITETAQDIEADIAVSLPPIEVGIFSITNISIDANFKLPFGQGPAIVGFGFASRANPFKLSVAIFGGGGYFGIGLGAGPSPSGVQTIDAGFEFGAMAAINLGVASGSVSLAAGVYYSYIVDPVSGDGPTCTLTGFVKLDGSLTILGIISLSLSFDLSLTYKESAGGHSVTGTATLTVGISFLFFHASVSMTATKTFSSSGNGGQVAPGSHRRLASGDGVATFGYQMSQADWNNYCAAFNPQG